MLILRDLLKYTQIDVLNCGGICGDSLQIQRVHPPERKLNRFR